jgi:hypothetical protein
MGGSCRYSFTSVTIPADVQTISIEQFQNNASFVDPTLAQTFTQKLRDEFLSRSRLSLAESGGDIVLSGAITQYDVEATNIQQGDEAAQNRLNISVFVKYENKQHPDESWEQNFDNAVNFPATTNLSSERAALNNDVTERLVKDVFTKALGEW